MVRIRKGRKKREERGLDRIGFCFGLGCQFRAERGRREKGERGTRIDQERLKGSFVPSDRLGGRTFGRRGFE